MQKQVKKQFMTIILTFVFALLFFGVTAMAADVTVSTYAELHAAVTSATEPTNIIVDADINFANPLIMVFGGQDITIKSSEGNNYTLTAANGNQHLFILFGSLTLENITFEGGYTGSGSATRGGIFNLEGNLTIKDGTFIQGCYGSGITNIGTTNILGGEIRGNTANFGGGISNSGGCTLNISGGKISGNRGIAYGGGVLNYGALNVTGGEISGNTTGFGGGIHNDGGNVVITGGKISGNIAAQSGGGIYNGINISEDDRGNIILTPGTVVCNGVEITENSASFGAGVYNEGGLTVNPGANIYKNTATNGGGIFNTGTATVNSGAKLFENTAANGGGIYIAENTVNINGGEISGNNATVNGGGVYVYDSTLNINNGKISGNTAVSGGGVYTTSITRVTAASALFSQNIASQAYWMTDAADIATHAAQITGTVSLSLPPAGNKYFIYAYNNYDISYAKGLTSNPLEYFSVTYDVIGANGALGAITLLDGSPIASGAVLLENTMIRFIATPDSGYHVKEWIINDEIQPSTGNYLDVELYDSLIVTVEFGTAPADHVVEFSVIGVNGSLEATVDDEPISSGDLAPYGKTVVFTAIPDYSYRVKEWIVNGVVQPETDNVFALVLTEDVVVTVEFEIKTYVVNFDVLGGNGTITATVDGMPILSGDLVTHGKTVVFASVPDYGYNIKEWVVNDVVQPCLSVGFIWTIYEETDVTVEFFLTDPISKVNLNVPALLALSRGQTRDLTFEVLPNDSSIMRDADGKYIITWASSNENVATIDQNGHLLATGMGSAVITLTIETAYGPFTTVFMVRVN